MRAIGNRTTGFSLMEMLISIVIGMVIVAAASTMLVNILKSQKDITTSARLNQELGAAMTVMSNEIRRAGFSVCDIEKMHAATPPLKCPIIKGQEVPFVSYALGEDIKIGGGGNCIEYRYNANLDNVDGAEEHRGFRLFDDNGRGVIQMADSNGDVLCGNNGNWVPLTDPYVINVTALSFSTTGSKCRNMKLPDPNPPIPSDPKIVALYWVVEEAAAAGVVQTGFACDDGTSPTSSGATTPVDYCTVAEDPSDPLQTVTTCDSGKTVGDVTVDIQPDDVLFGTRQITITLNAKLTRDSTVSKNLQTSVKVANPRIMIP